MKSPFKFLDSYTKDDRDIFFGREREIEELYHRVFDSKIMLVFGVSGTGKSSLIHCGLASKFRDSDWLNVNIRRGENIIKSMAEAIAAKTLINDAEITSAAPDHKESAAVKNPEKYFRKAVKNLYLDQYKPIYFIFDQFEELFILGTKEEDENLVRILKSLLSSDIQCKFIFILREEYLGWLSTFENSITGFFDNRIRVEKMDIGNARKAIEGPCKINNIAVEDGFAEKILEKLCPPNESEIELTYLQVYLDNIFKLAAKEVSSDNPSISFCISDIEKAGNVYDILGSFLDEQVSHLPDPELAMTILKAFVSARGTKRPANAEEIREYALTTGRDIDEKTINDLLISLVNMRILQDKDHNGRNELKHDALAAKIFEKVTLVEKELIELKQFIETAYSNWKKRNVLLSEDDLSYIAPYEDKLFLNDDLKSFIAKSKWEFTRIRHRRRNIFIALGISLLFVFAAFTVWALMERSNSLKQELVAKANYYNALSKDLVNDDPTKALRIAEYSCSLDPTEDNYQNLVDIYSNNEFYHTFEATRSLVVSSFKVLNQSGRIAIKESNKIMVFNHKGERIKEIDFGLPQNFDFDISTDEKYLLINANDDTLRIYNLSDTLITSIPVHNNVLETYFLPDSKKILSITGTDSIMYMAIFSVTGEKIAKNDVPLSTFGCFLKYNSSDTIYYITDSNELKCWITSENKITRTKLNNSFSEKIYRGLFISRDKFVTISVDDTLKIYDRKGKLYTKWYTGDNENRGFGENNPAFLEDVNMLCTRNDKIFKIWNLEGENISALKLANIPDYLSAGYNKHSGEVLILNQNQILSYVPNSLQNEIILRKEYSNTVYTVSEDIITAKSGKDEYIIIPSGDKIEKKLLRYDNDKIYYKNTGSRAVLNHYSENYKTPDNPEVTIYNLIDNKPLIRLEGITEMPASIVFSKDGNVIVSYNKLLLYGNGMVNISSSTFFNIYNRDGALLRTIPLTSNIFPNLKISNDNKNILLAENKAARLLDTSGNQLFRYSGHNEIIHNIDISDNGNYILTGSYDRTARLWTRDGKTLKIINTEGDYFKLSFLPGELIFQIADDNSVKLYDINGVLIQKVPVINENPIVYSHEDGYFCYIDIDGIHRTRMKEPIDSFLLSNNHRQLSLSDKIEYGIISVSEILKSNDLKELYQAGNYFLGVMNRKIDISEKFDAIKIAEKFFKKGLEYDTLRVQIAQRLSELSYNKYQYFNEDIGEDLEQYFQIMISENNPNELIRALSYYVSSLAFDSTYLSFGYPEKATSIGGKLVKLRPVNNNLKYRICFLCSNLSFRLLEYKSQYKNSLIAAKIAVKADSTYLNTYTNLPLAYIFNNMYDEAAEVYLEWKGKPYEKGEGFKDFTEVFLSDLDDLERRGITHPDFKKVRELLKK